MPAGVNETYRSVTFDRTGVPTTSWPKLSCSEANRLDLDVSDLRLDSDRALLFEGSGQIRVAGALRIFTDTPTPTEKLSILASGEVGIGTPTPTAQLEVNGTVKATSFQGDGSSLSGVIKTLDSVVSKAGDTMTGALTINNALTVSGNVGIGTIAPPTEKLEVNGAVKATTFKGSGAELTGLTGSQLQDGTISLAKLDASARPVPSQWINGASGSISYSGGNVGIGTTTPSQKLHVSGGNAIISNTFLGDVGYGPIWAGFSHSNSISPASYALLQSRDGFYTLINKKSGGGYLGFRVDNADKMIINDSGNVGIGVNPAYRLDVGGRMRVRQTANGASTAGIWLSGYYRQEFDAAFVGMKSLKEVGFWGNTAAAGWRLFVNTDNGTLSVTGGAFKPGGGAWGNSSDKRLKDNIRPLPNALDRLLKLRGVMYEWKQPEKQGNLTGPQIGLIAQEVEEVFPDWVGVDSDGYKTISIRGFEALTVEAFKQLKAENEWLRTRCETLEAKLETLQDRSQVVR